MLVKSIEIFKAHVRVNHNMAYPALTPILRRAERDYLLPVLDADMYAVLDAAANNSTPPTGSTLELVTAAQEVGALMGYYCYVPIGQLQQDDNGLHAMRNENYASPYQWQVGDYREEYLLAGYAAIENLYALLEKHRPAEWLNSDAASQYNDSLLRNATEFQKVYKIGNSRITYVDIKPAISRAEDLILRPTLGDAFYNSLIDHIHQDADASDSGDTTVFDGIMDVAVQKLRKALAPLTIGYAKEVRFRTVNGALLSTRFDGNKTTKDTDATEKELVDLRRNAIALGMDMLSAARTYLDANADNLPLFKGGPGYRALGKEELPASARMHSTTGFFMP